MQLGISVPARLGLDAELQCEIIDSAYYHGASVG